MKRLFPAFVYFLLVYMSGFAIVVAREFWIVIHTGVTLAQWVQLPVMIGISWLAASFVQKHILKTIEINEMVLVGTNALIMMLLAEAAMSWALRGITVFTLWANVSILAALANYAGILLFACMPIITGWQNRRISFH